MSTYESLGPGYDEDGDKCDIEQHENTTSQIVERLKELGRKVCFSRDFHQALLLGQLLSLLLCGTGVFSGLLQEQDFNFPVAQTFPLYPILGVLFTTRLAYRSGERNILTILRKDGWKYAILGLIDVEANFLVVKAYAYTSITSVQILDCFSLPTVLLLSRVFLKIQYKASHYVGVVVALVGMAGLIVADVLTGRNGDDGGSNQALGDFLVIAGAILYGVSNVCQEFVVKKFDTFEFLGMIGLFSSVYSGIQAIILERDGLAKVEMSYKIVLPWIGFIVVLFLIYTCMAYVIEKTSATVTNISMLSADFYSLIFGLVIFNYSFHFLYFISFAVVIVGVAVYSCQSTQTSSDLPQTSSDLPQTINTDDSEVGEEDGNSLR